MAEQVEAPLAMTANELEAFLAEVFPQVEGTFSIVSVRPLGGIVLMPFHERHLRPGGTMSGPAMMSLADYTTYVALLAQIGPIALAVTTNLTINFLRRPQQRGLIADCNLIKVGQRLAVGEVGLRSEGEAELAAHAVVTYALPPQAKR